MTFYIELHTGPDTSEEFYSLEARDLNEALGIANAFIKGAEKSGLTYQLRGISTGKVRGRKYADLL